MKLGLEEVNFLRLKIKGGTIIPLDHIAQKIKEFPDELQGRKHIQ